MREISFKNEYFLINKNENYTSIIDKNIDDNIINLLLYKISIRFMLYANKQIYYGKFKLDKNLNFNQLIKIINSPSKYYEKITIVEGWSKNDLNIELVKFFSNFNEIQYTKVLADTYMFSEGSSFSDFEKKIENIFISKLEKYKNHNLLKIFNLNEIFVIGSLLEKEGIDYVDKKKIFSVIINRLNKKMKLQIDATVIYAITEGKTDLKRKLNYNDLAIKHPYNTYYIYGLPPKPISYVGLKTIELIFENYKTDYLFYFYNSFDKNHVFSKDYESHLLKLNEYRSKK